MKPRERQPTINFDDVSCNTLTENADGFGGCVRFPY
jgi:hypothetical protein